MNINEEIRRMKQIMSVINEEKSNISIACPKCDHSWAIEDGSYLRINNLTLGYTLPKTISQKHKISSLRFFGTVNNLATLTGYSGYDPDVTARRNDPLTPGVDFAAYPRSRTWVFGLNLSF